ncbi:MAG TPA: LamG-like jellyroll fold domain-containing protein [Phycisphaerae bacterium]|nr:LamG-like jellyroll fold domain-containing protein [Phycisphaerae bacterium]
MSDTIPATADNRPNCDWVAANQSWPQIGLGRYITTTQTAWYDDVYCWTASTTSDSDGETISATTSNTPLAMVSDGILWKWNDTNGAAVEVGYELLNAGVRQFLMARDVFVTGGGGGVGTSPNAAVSRTMRAMGRWNRTDLSLGGYTLQATPTAPTIDTFLADGTGFRATVTGPANIGTGLARVTFHTAGADRTPVSAMFQDITDLTPNTLYPVKAKATSSDSLTSFSINTANGPRPGTAMGTVTRNATSIWGGTDALGIATASLSNFVNIAGSGSFNFPSNSLTIEARFRIPNPAATSLVSFNTSAAGGQDIANCIELWVVSGGYLQFRWKAADGTTKIRQTLAGALEANTWYHVAGTITSANPAVTSIYINGVSITGTTDANDGKPFDGATARVAAAIGRSYSNNGYTFAGTIDEVAIYNTALSATQIRNHFLAANHGAGNNSAGYAATIRADNPMAYYRLHEASGSFLDWSGTDAYGPSTSIYTLARQPVYTATATTAPGVQSNYGSSSMCVPSGGNVTFSLASGTAFNTAGLTNIKQFNCVWSASTTDPGSYPDTWTTGTKAYAVVTGQDRYLWLRSVNMDNTANTTSPLRIGPFNSSGGGIPGNPTPAPASNVGTDTITWNWQAVSGATGYEVWDAASGGTRKADLGAVTSWAEIPLDPGTSYSRWVLAKNVCGSSGRAALAAQSTNARNCPENGDFESGFTAGVGNRWVKSGTSGTWAQETTIRRDGANSQRSTDAVAGDPFNSPIYQKYNVQPNRGYTVTVHHFRNTGTSAGCIIRVGVDVNGGTTETVGGEGSGSIGQWIVRSLNFTSGAGGMVTLLLKAGYNDGSDTAYFDGVFLAPQSPTSTGGTTTICSGLSTNITASGGFGGSGGELKWYTGPAGTGTLVGTGSPLAVSPSSTTTYYPRWEASGSGSCNASADGAAVTVTVTPTPSAATNGTAVGSATSQITWGWTPPAGSGYRYDGYDAPTGGTWKWTTHPAVDPVSYLEAGLAPNTQYQRWVSTIKSGCESTSRMACPARYTLIQTPTGVTFGAVTVDSIQAGPSGTLSNLTAGSSGVRTAIVGGANSGWQQNTNAYIFINLTPNTEYGFQARARNGNGVETADSTAVTRWTLSAPPGAGTIGVIGTPDCHGGGNVDVEWQCDGFGAGKVAKYKYAFTQSPAHSFTGSEPDWSSGTKVVQANAAGTWYLHVKGYNGADVANGEYSYAVDIDEAVSISADPDDTNLTAGSNAQFSVTAGGGGSPTYRWQYDDGSGWVDLADGDGISGSATADLAIENVDDADQGQYRCIVTPDNGCDEAISAAAELTIAPQALTWRSIKIHGTVPYALAMPGIGNPLVEPRRGDILVRVVFDKTVKADDGNMDPSKVYAKDHDNGPVTVSSVKLVDDVTFAELPVDGQSKTMEIRLNLPRDGQGKITDHYLYDRKRLTLELLTGTGKIRCPENAKAFLGGDRDCQIRCLIGDVTQNGAVGSLDMVGMRARITTPLTQSNCMYDLNISGSITSVDLALLRSRLGNTVP